MFDAKRGTTATIDYNDSAQSFIVANDFGSIDMDESAVGEEWNSGEILPVTLLDQDLNKNTGSDEDLLVSGVSNQTTAELFASVGLATLVPSLQIGSPVTVAVNATLQAKETGASGAESVTSFSKVATLRGDIPSGASVSCSIYSVIPLLQILTQLILLTLSVISISLPLEV